MKARWKGQPQPVVDHAFKAQERLHRRYFRLTSRGKPAQVACIADGGITYSDNSASSDPGRDYLSELLCDLPPIIEGFISGHVDEEAMKRFTERVHEAAGKRKSWHHPMEINGWNW